MTREPNVSSGLTAVAKILTTVGLKGDLKVELLCSGPDRLDRLSAVAVGPDPASTVAYRFQGVRVQTNGIMVRLAEIADRTAAERLRGQFIFVPDAEAEPPQEGSVRVDDLIGFTVVDQDGRERGVVREVYAMPVYDLWGVWTGSKEVLIPAVAAWIDRLDRERRLVVLASIEGLFDA
ncbi:MAG: ribosome maturation factor RimM [Bacteroidetes bacterium]|nr:ribosome maturation factor RimM [Bacteroidota bacterium]